MTSNPIFLLQIVHADTGMVARLPGGGPLEADLIEACVQKILPKGVGLLRTQAAVEQAIREGITDALMSLKAQTRFLV